MANYFASLSLMNTIVPTATKNAIVYGVPMVRLIVAAVTNPIARYANDFAKPFNASTSEIFLKFKAIAFGYRPST
jgi:hypothetical protein